MNTAQLALTKDNKPKMVPWIVGGLVLVLSLVVIFNFLKG